MLQESGALELADLGVLAFTGHDAAGFLQGYLTQDMNALGDAPAFTAMCNIKGRTVLTGYVWREQDRVMLLAHRSLCPMTLDFLKPYLAFSKTQAVDVSDHCSILGAIGFDLGPKALPLDDERQLLVDVGSHGAEGADFVEQADALRATPKLRPAQWRGAAIERRQVWLEAATSGLFLPQMLALDTNGTVSFDKGCYLGQEVVARAQHQGEVKRRLTRLNWRGAPMPIGAAIQGRAGRAVGVLVAVAGEDEDAAGSALAVIAKGATAPFSTQQGSTTLTAPPG